MLELSGFEKEKAKVEGEKLSRNDWTFEEMQTDYRILSELEAKAGVETETAPGGYNPLWNIRTDLAIAIIREERYKVRREIAHEQKKEQEAEERRKARRH